MFFNKKRPNVQFINQIGKKAEYDAKRVPYVFDDFINDVLLTDSEIPRAEINNMIQYQQKTNFFLNAALTMFHHGWMNGYVKRHYQNQLNSFLDELSHELENIHGPNFKKEIEKAISHRKIIVYIASFLDQLYELGYNLGSQSEYIERKEM
ncbi:hypothetical protein [Priestia flexa]|uniref:Uncharacterized protein n=1 Tax=Priestia flexa TaxID=86664 RepID=A0ABU4JB72_9BACI|nr:hypothetical protein [Priestia flexa]MDW8518266.1 hypothetical protein [Priestia flexa]